MIDPTIDATASEAMRRLRRRSRITDAILVGYFVITGVALPVLAYANLHVLKTNDQLRDVVGAFRCLALAETEAQRALCQRRLVKAGPPIGTTATTRPSSTPPSSSTASRSAPTSPRPAATTRPGSAPTTARQPTSSTALPSPTPTPGLTLPSLPTLPPLPRVLADADRPRHRGPPWWGWPVIIAFGAGLLWIALREMNRS